MLHLLTIIGARPQIIKAAAISRTIKNSFSNEICEHIVHTGQHYDQNMSQVFFDELNIPQPDFNLGVGSGTHGTQTAKMIEGIEQILLHNHYDGIVLYGDTNSTLAGAVAASKLNVPVFHVEAGLRSNNMTMPEEVNRIVCDNLSTILFAPTHTAYDNLLHESLNERAKVVLSGDVMYDNCLYFSSMADEKSDVLERYGLHDGDYVLATVHRDFNTDNRGRLMSILQALDSLPCRVVLPMHPRTRSRLGDNADLGSNIQVVPPASFFEILSLQRHAQLVVTDSGGVQKEAFFLHKPCLIARPETEWVEIIRSGAGLIVDADPTRITDGYRTLVGKTIEYPSLFGNGAASESILREIVNHLKVGSINSPIEQKK